ncbi:hypothetical protein [Streptomyces sp. 3N207]
MRLVAPFAGFPFEVWFFRSGTGPAAGPPSTAIRRRLRAIPRN